MAPILTIHGEKDMVVPPDQARMFDSRMKEVGASHTLVMKSALGHNDELDQNVWNFLERILK